MKVLGLNIRIFLFILNCLVIQIGFLNAFYLALKRHRHVEFECHSEVLTALNDVYLQFYLAIFFFVDQEEI